MDIREALSKLDTLDDDLWTTGGEPKIEAVKDLLGRPVTRQEIIDAAPTFSRSNTDLTDEEPEQKEDPEPELEEELDDSMIVEFLTNPPVTIQEFLPFLASVPKSLLVALQEGLEDQQAKALEARKQLDEFEGRIRQALSYTRSRVKNEVPDMSDAEANRAYIEGQARARAERAAVSAEILKGLDVKKLDPRSPIDRAFARKTARGTQRPGS